MAHTNLDAHRNATTQFPNPTNEINHFVWVGKGRMAKGTVTIVFGREFEFAGLGDFLANLGPWQQTTVSRFGTLRYLDFHHFDLSLTLLDCFLKHGWFKDTLVALSRPTPKVSRSHVPYQISSSLSVPFRDTSLASVVEKVAPFGTAAEGQNGILGNGAVAHGANVQNGRRVGLGRSKGFSANGRSGARFLVARLGEHGMTGPLVVHPVDVATRSKGNGVVDVLGALIDLCPVQPIKGNAIKLRLDQILPNLWSNLQKKKGVGSAWLP